MSMVKYVLHIWSLNIRWMSWNLFLAFIPLGLSVWLFRSQHRSRSLLWWAGFVSFIAFLPNAPYVLTDVIHLIHDIRQGYSVWTIALLLMPQYLLFMVAGFEAYVLSLINFGYGLKQQGWGRWVLWIELTVHTLSAIGVYLGRFLRFNSWDLVTQLDEVTLTVVNDLTAKRPALVIFITLIVITTLYWLLKQLTLAVTAYYRQPQQDISQPHPTINS